MNEFGDSFEAIILHDVKIALDRVSSGDDFDRRIALRAIISAIEGITKQYGDRVKSILKEMDMLDSLTALAFEEEIYSVSKQGVLKRKSQFLPLISMIRFISLEVKKVDANIEVDFGNIGWESLQESIKLRHDITHPKTKEDLNISIENVEIAASALFWFLDIVADVLEKAVTGHRHQISQLREVLDLLKVGDKPTLELYQKVLQEF